MVLPWSACREKLSLPSKILYYYSVAQKKDSKILGNCQQICYVSYKLRTCICSKSQNPLFNDFKIYLTAL